MDPVNKILFSFPAYNAGPVKVQRIRKKTAEMGLNLNVWFQNAECGAAQIIGRETVQYDGNIYKYYITYRLVVDQMVKKQEVKKKSAK